MSEAGSFQGDFRQFPARRVHFPGSKARHLPLYTSPQLRCRIHRREVAQILTCPIQGFQGAAIIVWSEYGL